MSRLNNSLLSSLVAISATDSLTSSSAIRTINGVKSYNTSNMTNSTQEKVKKAKEAAQILNKSKIVCFDVDSTVIQEEGIDELAKFCGKGQEVSRLTKEAMGGAMTFQEALRRRLDIINPTQKQIKEFVKKHPSTLSPGVKELITHLKSRNIQVYLITGGFSCLIEPVAKAVGIPMENVFANKLLFFYNGDYAGFDTNQPTSHSGGKGEAIAMIKILNSFDPELNSNEEVITMIGDGATDLEACPPANYFIGYGGNVIREEVRTKSQYFITDFSQVLQSD